jgi:hypothetical protein
LCFIISIYKAPIKRKGKREKKKKKKEEGKDGTSQVHEELTGAE